MKAWILQFSFIQGCTPNVHFFYRDTTITDVTNSWSPSYQSIHIQLLHWLHCGGFSAANRTNQGTLDKHFLYWSSTSKFGLKSIRFQSFLVINKDQRWEPPWSWRGHCILRQGTNVVSLDRWPQPTSGNVQPGGDLNLCPGKGNHVHQLFHVFTFARFTNCTSLRSTPCVILMLIHGDPEIG